MIDSTSQIVIAGAGNFGREVEGWLNMRGVPVAGFLDDTKHGHRTIRDYERYGDEQVLVSISNPKDRERVVEYLNVRKAVFHGMLFNIAPPQCYIAGGCIFCPQSLVSRDAEVGEFVHVNVFSSVGHNVVVGDFCTISSHVDLCGHVTLGKRVFVGSGARVLPGLCVGDDAVIGAGAVVVRNVPAGATVYAEPARTL